MIVELYETNDLQHYSVYRDVIRLLEMGNEMSLTRFDNSVVFLNRDDYCMVIFRSDDD